MIEQGRSTSQLQELWRVARWALTLLPIAITMAFVNGAVDPARIIRLPLGDRDAFEKRVASALVRNAFLVGSGVYDERLVQRYIGTQDSSRRDVLVLGSSRLFQVHPPEHDSIRARNASVSGASMEDLVALYGIHVTPVTAPPAVLILGVDPWMLNVNNGQARWRAIAREYVETRARLALPVEPRPFIHWQRLREQALALFSAGYFKTSLRVGISRMRGKPDLSLSERQTNDEMTRWPDGSVRYGRAVRSISLRDAEAAATAYSREEPMFGLGEFRSLDSLAIADLNAILSDARRRAIRVVIVLAPYPPIVYQRMRSDAAYRLVAPAEEAIRRVASGWGVPVVLSYDPARAGVVAPDFFDGMHLTEQTVARLLPMTTLVAIAR